MLKAVLKTGFLKYCNTTEEKRGTAAGTRGTPFQLSTVL